jgi:hypothetical protein
MYTKYVYTRIENINPKSPTTFIISTRTYASISTKLGMEDVTTSNFVQPFSSWIVLSV